MKCTIVPEGLGYKKWLFDNYMSAYSRHLVHYVGLGFGSRREISRLPHITKLLFYSAEGVLLMSRALLMIRSNPSILSKLSYRARGLLRLLRLLFGLLYILELPRITEQSNIIN